MSSLLNYPLAILDSITELQSFDGTNIRPNQLVRIRNTIVANDFEGATHFQFRVGYAGTDSTAQLVVGPATGATGKWVCVDPVMNIQIPSSTFTFNLADAATLFTVPTGFRLLIQRVMIEIGVAWTGGAASAIGISSSNANFNTKGDLLGGATGDVAAGLASGFQGTIGTKIAQSLATRPPVVLNAGETIRFDRITSAFTAGVGVLNIICNNVF